MAGFSTSSGRIVPQTIFPKHTCFSRFHERQPLEFWHQHNLKMLVSFACDIDFEILPPFFLINSFKKNNFSPKDTSFAEPSQVPDYVQQVQHLYFLLGKMWTIIYYNYDKSKNGPQAMPYMVTLIIIEALINWLGRGHRWVSVSWSLGHRQVSVFQTWKLRISLNWYTKHCKTAKLLWSHNFQIKPFIHKSWSESLSWFWSGSVF